MIVCDYIPHDDQGSIKEEHDPESEHSNTGKQKANANP